jgi:hypothetical protein
MENVLLDLSNHKIPLALFFLSKSGVQVSSLSESEHVILFLVGRVVVWLTWLLLFSSLALLEQPFMKSGLIAGKPNKKYT